MATPLTLLSGESVILSSENDRLVLTNYRVKYEAVGISKSIYKSIPIDKVASCALSTRSYPILLVLAAAAMLAIFVAPENEFRIGAGILAAIFAVLYFRFVSGICG